MENNATPITWEECLDKVAQKYGFENWEALKRAEPHMMHKPQYRQAAELLATERAEDELRKSIKLLRDLADLQNGPPLERHRKEWEETMNDAYEFLNLHDDPLPSPPTNK